ncbi:cupredoxin domain-containing protein [Kocuria sp. M1N1S27]|uniref:cupredoxin domain-containing protein n=1 Tax=Kocuria kalidii TaxID=3376283 RepID=UPI0037983646
MQIEHAVTSVALIAALAGATGCGARSGPSGEVPEAPSAGASAAGTPQAPATEEPVITVEDFAYELPASVAPGATVTVINEGDATHTVTAEDDSFEAVVAGGGTTTFLAPEQPGDYAVACAYHAGMSGTLTVE